MFVSNLIKTKHTGLLSYALISFSSLFLLSLFFFPSFLPSSSFAEPGVVATPSLTISPSGSLDLIVSPNVFSSAEQTVSVSTTNYTGYKLYLSTAGTTTDLVDTNNNELTIPTIELPEGNTEGLTASDITLGYGYSLDGTNYKPAPATSSEHGDELDNTDSATTGTEYTLTFGAKVNDTTPVGVYSNSYMLTAVANDTLYSIAFDANAGAETVTNMPNTSSTSLSGIDIILPFNPAPTRTGYLFLGWDEDQAATEPTYTSNGIGSFTLDPETDNQITLYAIWGCGNGYICYDGNGADAGEMVTSTLQASKYSANASVQLVAPNYSRANYGFAGWNTAADGTGTNYGPNQTITMPNGSLQLYANWLAADPNVTMQSFDPSDYSSQTNDFQIALRDTRDNNVYVVAKLSDGHFWMTENLRLDLSNSNTSISNSNTDYPTSSFSTSANNHPTSNNTFCSIDDSTCVNQIQFNSNNINRSLTASPTENNNKSSWYSYGVAYNWYTATAGNGTFEFSVDGANAFGSICPSGWRLPTGGDNGEYYALNVATNSGRTNNSTGLRAYPVNMVFSGEYKQSSAYIRGKESRYWTATAWNADSSYRFKITSGAVNFAYYNKTQGMYVRCINGSGTRIVYEPNADDVEDDVDVQLAVPNSSVVLYAPNYAREGYGFVGWNTAADGSGTMYGPNQTIATGDSQDEITLYAIWQEKETNVTMQNFDATGYSSATTGFTIALEDERDGQVYTVRKLADGNFWMTENLRLDLSDTDVNINSANTNNPTTVFSTTANAHPSSSNTFCAERNSACFDQVLFNATNINTAYAQGSNSRYAYGVYYNWYTATAGNGTYANNPDTENRTGGDICPKGWHLPDSNSTDGGFSVLSAAVGGLDSEMDDTTNPTGAEISNTLRSIPNNFVFSGDYSGTSARSQYVYGRFWTSRPSANDSVHTMAISSDTVVPGLHDNNFRHSYGYSVRCIANNASETFTLKYNANNTTTGTNIMTTQTGTSANRSYTFTIPNETPVYPGYTFMGWALNGSSAAEYQPGDNITVSYLNNELRAIWSPYVTVKFDANGGVAGIDASRVMPDKPVFQDTQATLPKNNYAKNGYIFSGWSLNPSTNYVDIEDAGTYRAPSSINGNEIVILYAVWGRRVVISYDGNGADEGSMPTVNTVEYRPQTLTASNYSRIGYGFAGWSLDPNATVNGASTIYGPNEAYRIPAYSGDDNTITFYAVWVPVATDENNNELTFQTTHLTSVTLSDGSTLASKNNGYVTALRDTRDNDVYAVAKLADGHYWMIENLRLDYNANITTANTQSNNGSFGGVFTGLAEPEEASNFVSDSGIGVESPNSLYSINNITGNNLRFRFPRYNNENTASRGTSANGYGAFYGYGNYYTWAAAIADTSDYTSGAATTSLCPSGWHLPSGGQTGEFASLSTALGGLDSAMDFASAPTGKEMSDVFRAYPNNIVLAGRATGGEINNRGQTGILWSSNSYSAKNADVFYNHNHINYKIVDPGFYTAKSSGATVRCVAD